MLHNLSYRLVIVAEGEEELENVAPRHEPHVVDKEQTVMRKQKTATIQEVAHVVAKLDGPAKADVVEEDDNDDDGDVYESDVDSDGSETFTGPREQSAVAECNAAAEVWLRATKSAETNTRTRLVEKAEETLSKRDIVQMGQPDTHSSQYSVGVLRARRSELMKKFIKAFKSWGEKAQVVTLEDLASPMEGEAADFNRGRDRVLGKLLRWDPPPSLPRVKQLPQQCEPLPPSVLQRLASQDDWSNVTFHDIMISMTRGSSSSNNNNKRRNLSAGCESGRQLRRRTIDH